MTRGPRLVVVSGPSGVGKTSVVAELERRKGFERVVTATTRAPRGAEKDGVDYRFLPREEFLRLREAGEFLEWAEVHGQLYGTPRRAVEEVLRRGRHALLNVDVQGAAAVRGSRLPRLLVFLLPPSLAVLEARLRGRGTDDPAAVRRRLAAAQAELARQDEFDVKVVSDTVAAAADRIEAALAGE